MQPKHLIINGLAILLLLCASPTLGAPTPGAASEKSMNVLMLISDDLNSWLLENPERYAGKVIAPNMNALA